MNTADNMCFTCLKTNNKKLVNVNKLDADKISFLDKLKMCITEELVQNKVMEMCTHCLRQLRNAYKFRETVLISQGTLSKYYTHYNSDSSLLKEENISFSFNGSDEYKDNSFLNNVVENLKKLDDCSGEHTNYYLCDMKEESKEELLGEVQISPRIEHSSDEDDVIKIEVDNSCNMSDATSDNESIKEPKIVIKRPSIELDLNCNYCGKQFDKRWRLQKHVTRVHTEEKKFPCTYCDRSFKQSHHLREHIAIHTGEKIYSCTYCDKRFHRLSSQRRHIKSHEKAPGQKTKRTPFLCTICGKNFPFSNGAQRHMRIHMGLRTHECTLCDRKFTQSTHLHVHMRTHSGEKPYICEGCGEAFSLKASLQKHMVVHQKPENVYISEECSS